MDIIPDKAIDMILCDLPYGKTSCKWDNVIPFEPLWEQYERVIKDNGAIVLFGSEPFASKLRLSNLKLYKYDWIWLKSKASGFMNAKLKPMSKYENIIIFSKGKTSPRNPNNMIYNSQGLIPYNKVVDGTKNGINDKNGHRFWRPSTRKMRIQEFTNYPVNVLKFNSEGKTVHPTQKPVKLFEYLVKTYTNEGELVLDNCIGSGTTAIACINTNRNYIGFELDTGYFNIAQKRIEDHVKSGYEVN